MLISANTILQNRYLVKRLLGQGGMGAVYQAVDQQDGATLALKQSLVKDANLQKAFEREARILTRLRHPSLPVVSDFFCEEAAQFLVMQYIGGDDLGTLLERKRDMFLSERAVPWIIRWTEQLLDALTYLHNQDPPVIHRDIKPQNLKLSPEGTIMLLDFGLAKSVGDQTRHSIVHSVRAYSTQYAPLEQIQGTGTDRVSDIYALAATMYHLITGHTPPDAISRFAAMLEGRPDPLRSASELNTLVPPVVALIFHQALAQKTSERFASASAMRKALSMATNQAGISTSSTNQRVSSTSSSQASQRRATTSQPGRISQHSNAEQQASSISQPLQTQQSAAMISQPYNGSRPTPPPSQIDSSGLHTLVVLPTEPPSVPDTSAPAMPKRPSTTPLPPNRMSPTTASLSTNLVVDQRGEGHYQSINEAVAQAEPGSRIFVRPGIYREGIVLDKTVEIIAEGPREKTVIECQGIPCIQMRVNYAVVRGLTLRRRSNNYVDSNPAVDISQGRLVLEQCDISTETMIGVAVSTPDARPVLYRCTIHDSQSVGVLFSRQSRGTVEECDFSGNVLAAIKVVQGSNPVIRQCTIHHGKQDGLRFADRGAGTVEECDIFENGDSGIQISQNSSPFVRWCTIHHHAAGYGVAVYDEGEGVLEECDIFENGEAGLSITRRGNPFIRRCKIHDEHKREVIVADRGRGILEGCTIIATPSTGVSVCKECQPVVQQCYIHIQDATGANLWDNRYTGKQAQQRQNHSNSNEHVSVGIPTYQPDYPLV